jgi:hypothetical protein
MHQWNGKRSTQKRSIAPWQQQYNTVVVIFDASKIYILQDNQTVKLSRDLEDAPQFEQACSLPIRATQRP